MDSYPLGMANDGFSMCTGAYLRASLTRTEQQGSRHYPQAGCVQHVHRNYSLDLRSPYCMGRQMQVCRDIKCRKDEQLKNATTDGVVRATSMPSIPFSKFTSCLQRRTWCISVGTMPEYLPEEHEGVRVQCSSSRRKHKNSMSMP